MQLFARARAPLFEFSAQMPFPKLGDEFVSFIADRFEYASRRVILRHRLQHAFASLDRMPRPFMDLVYDMLKDGATDVDAYLDKHLSSRVDRLDFVNQWHEMRPMERLVLRRVAEEEPIYNAPALAWYAEQLGVERVSVGAAQHAAKKLEDANLIAPAPNRRKTVQSDCLRVWVMEQI